jgi:glycerol-3-phosphate dehydrogenase
VDLLVVGGGIYGAWIAYDGALRGLRVALVERTDWAAGTSSASSKLIHGGLRYLEQLRLGLVRTSLVERKRLRTLAPHRIQPLRFLVPVYSGDRIGRWRVKLGLTLYDLLAGVDPPVGRHRSIGREELLALAPFLRRDGLRGGFGYGDCVMDDARYTLEIVDGALRAGAAAVNQAEVAGLLEHRGRIRGAAVVDRETGETVEVEARLTVDCGGAWSAEVVPERQKAERLFRLTKGAHLVMPALAAEGAFLLFAGSDGRVFFLIPWYGRTLLGTTDTPFGGDPDEVGVTPEDVRYLLTAAGRYLGDRAWTESDILGRSVGLRCLRNGRRGTSPSKITREWSLEEPMPGLLMPVGGKYTSARADAARVVDRALELVGRGRGENPTRDRPFPWAPAEPFVAWLERVVSAGVALGLDPEAARHAAHRFGARVEKIHQILRDRPELASRIHPELPFCRAEIVHAVESEMARTLEDVLRRRIPLTLLSRPDERRLREAADVAGELLGWSEDRRRQEVASVLDRLGRGDRVKVTSP